MPEYRSRDKTPGRQIAGVRALWWAARRQERLSPTSYLNSTGIDKACAVRDLPALPGRRST